MSVMGNRNRSFNGILSKSVENTYCKYKVFKLVLKNKDRKTGGFPEELDTVISKIEEDILGDRDKVLTTEEKDLINSHVQDLYNRYYQVLIKEEMLTLLERHVEQANINEKIVSAILDKKEDEIFDTLNEIQSDFIKSISEYLSAQQKPELNDEQLELIKLYFFELVKYFESIGSSLKKYSFKFKVLGSIDNLGKSNESKVESFVNYLTSALHQKSYYLSLSSVENEKLKELTRNYIYALIIREQLKKYLKQNSFDSKIAVRKFMENEQIQFKAMNNNNQNKGINGIRVSQDEMELNRIANSILDEIATQLYYYSIDYNTKDENDSGEKKAIAIMMEELGVEEIPLYLICKARMKGASIERIQENSEKNSKLISN